MITNEIIIKLKGCSRKQRLKVRSILLKNYIELLHKIIEEADYCTVDSYWKNHKPLGKPITNVEKFISKFTK